MFVKGNLRKYSTNFLTFLTNRKKNYPGFFSKQNTKIIILVNQVGNIVSSRDVTELSESNPIVLNIFTNFIFYYQTYPNLKNDATVICRYTIASHLNKGGM